MDLIDRQAAQTELMMKYERYTLARESHGMGRVEWSSDLISVADAMDAIRDLPSAQPEPKQNTMPEQLKMNRFGVKMGKTCTDAISRQDAIGAVNTALFPKINTAKDAEKALRNLPSAQPDSFVDADKLKRCRFEYINACKIVARPTPDTSKNDIYDAHAVIKALYPIFGDEEF